MSDLLFNNSTPKSRIEIAIACLIVFIYIENRFNVIKIYDVNETPPKVSLQVSTKLQTNVTSELMEFDIVNRLDAILETPY